MKLTSSILSVTACCSVIWVAHAQENYSLWPRRPVELEQARRLYVHGKDDAQALTLLGPFINKRGLAGREARRLVGLIRIRQYLSTSNPHMLSHIVKRGENLERIATTYNSTAELLALINLMTNPSDLKAGQRVNVAPADLRLELHVGGRELTLWDGRTLVAAYDVQPSVDLKGEENEETKLSDRDGEINGAHVPRASALFASSDRMLTFANGLVLINDTRRAPKKAYVQMQRKDLNELSLLVRGGARLSVVRKEESFDPFATVNARKVPPKRKREGSSRSR